MKKLIVFLSFVLICTIAFPQTLKWVQVTDTSENFTMPTTKDRTLVFDANTGYIYHIKDRFTTSQNLGDVLADATKYAIVAAGDITNYLDSVTLNLSDVDSLEALNLGAITPVNSTQATDTSDMTNANADLYYTSVPYGTAGNSTSVVYVDPGASDQSLRVSVNSSLITITLATEADTASSDTIGGVIYTAVNGGTDGDSITVAHIDPASSGQALSVAVVDSAITVNLATEVDTAAYATIGGVLYTAVNGGTDGDSITVAHVDPGAPDQTLSVAVVDSAITVNLATGSGSAITSTQQEVVTAILADASAAALVTADTTTGASTLVTAAVATNLSGGYDGGTISSTQQEIVTAIGADGSSSALVTATVSTGASDTATAATATNLSGGYDGGAITSTAAEIKAAIEALPAATALVTVEDESTGAGIVNALAESSLSGGAEATPTAEIGAYGFKSDRSLFYIKNTTHTWSEAELSGLDSTAAAPTDPVWQDWEPTFTWGGGDLTVSDTVARYVQDGNTVFFQITIRGTNTSGSANTGFWITPPVTPYNTPDDKMFQPALSCIINQDGNDPANGTEGAIPWGAYINMDDSYTSLLIYNTKDYSIANTDAWFISISGFYEAD